MCGIAGFVSHRGYIESIEPVRRMLTRMQRRGPDAEGLWAEARGIAVLGHRRLAILDLDARANQPMTSADGRFEISFNGEIYNFRELRAEIERDGAAFRTESDTEVLLALWARGGEAMLSRLRGMYALALWDATRGGVFLARDPYGIKPLYTATTLQGTLFASQVKALLASGLVASEPCPHGQAGFWLMGNVPEPHTWYRDIRALPAGCCQWITTEGPQPVQRHADIADAWRHASACPLSGAEIAARVREAVLDSVRAHLVADVPVAVFLSGGIDSGALAGLMRELGVADVCGVTVAFDEFAGSGEDEARPAALLARHYGLRHHVRRVTRAEFEVDLPRIIDAMDQPSVDGINTWYASKAVAELGYKVVLSGVGGDELFGGYASFRDVPRAERALRIIRRLPGGQAMLRALLAAVAWRTGNPRWPLLARYGHDIAGAYVVRRGLFSPQELPALMGEELAHAALVDFDAPTWARAQVGALPADGRLAVGQLESTLYLRNQLLRDSDWASMDHSVELRTPLVDAELLREIAPLLPLLLRMTGKAALAATPQPSLPAAICRKPKTGFALPLKNWLAARNDDTAPAADVYNSRAVAKLVAMAYST